MYTAVAAELMDPCAKMGMSTLPLVLLNTHVKMIVIDTAQITNKTTSRRLPCGVSQLGMRNRGRCQSAQRVPRMRLPISGPYSRWSLGSANPRQPISSNTGPPAKRNMGVATTYRNSVEGTADALNEARAPGTTTVESNMIAGMPKRTNRYHRK